MLVRSMLLALSTYVTPAPLSVRAPVVEFRVCVTSIVSVAPPRKLTGRGRGAGRNRADAHGAGGHDLFGQHAGGTGREVAVGRGEGGGDIVGPGGQGGRRREGCNAVCVDRRPCR